MICHAYLTNGKVLKSNGTYTDISKIQKGDKVINIYGKAVNVRSVIKNHVQRKGLIHIKNDSWNKLSILKCTEDQRILIWDDREKRPSWIQADYIQTLETEIDSPKILFPTKIRWDLPNHFEYKVTNDVTLSSSESLGFLFGAFMRVGFIRLDNQTVRFHCDTSTQIVTKKIMESVQMLFGILPEERKKVNVFDMTFKNELMYKVFEEFGESAEKCLPEKYRCTDNDYVQGILNGIIYSGTLGQPEMSGQPKVYETLYWAAITSNKPLSYGQLVRKYQNKDFLTGRISKHNYSRDTTDMYTLDVECDTGTFIVNNIVVTNDD
jgi:hypothetical protein